MFDPSTSTPDALRHFIAPNIRVVSQGGVAIMLDGQARRLSDLEGARPFLLLNPDEFNEQDAKQLAQSDWNRQQFTFGHRTKDLYHDHKQEAETARNAPPFNSDNAVRSMFGSSRTDHARNALALLGSQLSVNAADSEIESTLAGLYDDTLGSLESEWPESIKHAKRIAAMSRAAHVSHHFMRMPLDEPTMTAPEPEPIETPEAAEARTTSQREIEYALSEIYGLLNPDMQTILEAIGVEVLVADHPLLLSHKDNWLGDSNYGQGKIRLTTEAHAYHVLEEFIHQVDGYLNLSQKPEWKQAAMADLTSSQAARALLAQASNNLKAPIERYPADQQPEEVFAELSLLDQLGLHPEGQSLAEAFPHSWPIYETFRESIHEKAEELRKPRMAVSATGCDHEGHAVEPERALGHG